MTEPRVERRLAAFLAADDVGYSRLTEANEERVKAECEGPVLLAGVVDEIVAAVEAARQTGF